MKTFLSSISPFQGLPRAELERLVGYSQEKKFSRGETIFSEGDEAGLVWVLKEGRVQIVKYSSEGKPLTIEVIQPGELFGTLCRLGGSRIYPCTAIASVDSSVVYMPDRVFFGLMGAHQSVLSGVCSLCSQRLTDLQGMTCSSQEPVERRVARMLLKLKGRHGTTIPYTKKEIAEMVGTTIETTFRVLAHMRDSGLLESLRGSVIIKDPKGLEKIADTIAF